MDRIKKSLVPLVACLCMLFCLTTVQAKTVKVVIDDDLSFSYAKEARTIKVGHSEDVFNIVQLTGSAAQFKVKYSVSDKTIAEFSKNILTGKTIGTVKVVAKVFYDNEQVWRGAKYCTVANDLTGKTMLCLGDSLMCGHLLSASDAWPALMGETYQLGKVYNRGKNGMTITGNESVSGNLLFQLRKKVIGVIDDVDIIVIEGGANDYHLDKTIGKPGYSKKTTFCGALNTAITRLQAAYPNAKIYCMTNYCRIQLDRVNNVGATSYDYVEAMEQVCALRGIPCFNNYLDSGLNFLDPKCIVWADEGYELEGEPNQHLSREAYKYLVPIYADFLMKN